MNPWSVVETVLVALLVSGATAYVARSAWRSVRRMSQATADGGDATGCNTCGACPSGRVAPGAPDSEDSARRSGLFPGRDTP
jgi:hypothetical protein